jgi:hypothetical protein
VWREALESVQRSLKPGLEAIEASENKAGGMSPEEMAELARYVPPGAGVSMAAAYIERLLRDLLSSRTEEHVSCMLLPKLASLAQELRLIDDNLAHALHGLLAMRAIASSDPERVTEWQEAEFVGTAVAIAHLLQIAINRHESAEDIA